MLIQMQQRRAPAASWTSANPILADGEIGLETDTQKLKFGDGTTAWNTLPYFSGATVDISGKANIASPTFTGVPAAPTAAVDTNTTQLATTAYVVGQGYLKSATAASTYLTQATAASTYLTTSTAGSTYLTQANAATTYQPKDTDLTNIAALTGTAGFLKTDGANIWSVDTASYSPLAGSSSIVTTGTVTSGTWSGSFGAVSGANLTSLTAGSLSGTIPSAVLGNSTVYIGTTGIALNRASAALTIAGLTLTTPTIDGIVASAAGATNALWAANNTGSIAIGSGLTTGALNIAASGTGATPITIGHTNATIGIVGNTTITGTLAATSLAGSLLSSATPLVDGTAAAGNSAIPARDNHVHPTDTTRAQDTLVVHLAGNESITGIKTFTARTHFHGPIQLYISGTDPAAPEQGDVYYSDVSLIAKMYNGASWNVVADLEGTQTFTGAKTFSAKTVFRTSNATAASINIPHGTAPTTPTNGDVWTTTSGLQYQINGATVEAAITITPQMASLIQVDNRTDTHTAQFAYGATTTGLTKTVQIGMGGVSGSTTEVTLGSTAGTSGITLNGTTTVVGKLITDEYMVVALSDEATALTTGTAVMTFRAPFAMTLTSIPRAFDSTASSSGIPTVDIKKNGTTILGANKLTIDATEKTSVTAVTATSLATTTVADDDEITFDITTAGTGTKGLKVTIYYKRT
jgi:hypothetical protein